MVKVKKSVGWKIFLAIIITSINSCGLSKTPVEAFRVNTLGLEVFNSKVLPKLQESCDSCHDSQSPNFASSSPNIAYTVARRYVDFKSTGELARITEYSSNAHCLRPECDRSASRREVFSKLMDEWIVAENTVVDPGEEEENFLPDTVTDPLPVPASLPASLNWDLSSISADLSGSTFNIVIDAFGGGYLLAEPKLTAGSKDVSFKGVYVVINGVIQRTATTYANVSFTVSAGETQPLLIPDVPAAVAGSGVADDTIAIYFEEIKVE